MQALWMLLACVCFGTMGMMVKLVADDVSLATVVFFRGAVPLLLLATWAMARGHSLKSPVLHLHAKRNGAGIVAMWCGFYATSHLPLATATTLLYTSPIFIALIMRLRGPSSQAVDQAAAKQQTAMIVLGFLGVVLVLQPHVSAGLGVYAAIGLIAGMVSAVAYLQLKSLGNVNEPEWRTVMYFAVTAAFTSLLAMLATSDPMIHGAFLELGAWTWLWLIGLGFFGGAGNLALTRSFGSGSTWMSAALQYMTILVSAVYGWAAFNDVPNLVSWIGGAVIMACGALSAYHTHKNKA